MRLDNKWLAHAPAKTVKGNSKDSSGEVEDVPFNELNEEVLTDQLDDLPWGDPDVRPSVVAIKQGDEHPEYVEDGYVEEDYVKDLEHTWVKLTWDQFIAFVDAEL